MEATAKKRSDQPRGNGSVAKGEKPFCSSRFAASSWELEMASIRAFRPLCA